MPFNFMGKKQVKESQEHPQEYESIIEDALSLLDGLDIGEAKKDELRDRYRKEIPESLRRGYKLDIIAESIKVDVRTEIKKYQRNIEIKIVKSKRVSSSAYLSEDDKNRLNERNETRFRLQNGHPLDSENLITSSIERLIESGYGELETDRVRKQLEDITSSQDMTPLEKFDNINQMIDRMIEKIIEERRALDEQKRIISSNIDDMNTQIFFGPENLKRKKQLKLQLLEERFKAKHGHKNVAPLAQSALLMLEACGYNESSLKDVYSEFKQFTELPIPEKADAIVDLTLTEERFIKETFEFFCSYMKGLNVFAKTYYGRDDQRNLGLYLLKEILSTRGKSREALFNRIDTAYNHQLDMSRQNAYVAANGPYDPGFVSMASELFTANMLPNAQQWNRVMANLPKIQEEFLTVNDKPFQFWVGVMKAAYEYKRLPEYEEPSEGSKVML